MYAPHTVTIYNIIRETDFESITDTEQVGVTVLRGVMLQADCKVRAHEPGLADNSSVTLYIPQNAIAENGETGLPETFVDPSTYMDAADKSGMWTLSVKSGSIETLIVKGESTEDVNTLRNGENCWKVTGVALKDFGGAGMQHWEVQGA